jgi:undecaprenyl-diphosphatase
VNAGQGIVLGIVQGLTEFLPISSTGHIRIVPALAGWKDPGTAFTAVIQLGTMLAVVVYFWREIIQIIAAWFRGLTDRSVRGTLEYRLGWYVIFATIPIGIFGLIFQHQIDHGARNLWLIAGAEITLGVLMGIADKVGARNRNEEQISVRDGVAVGLAQCASLIPGVSRSGSTITAGLFVGLDRPAAARFSFLLSIPAVVLSGLFELKDLGNGNSPGAGVTLLATVLAFVVGLASIHWLIRYLSRHGVGIFVAYRILLGALLIGLLSAVTISAT